jgi:TctA family transporter
MNSTSVTALIITFHNISAVGALTLALILTLTIFLLFFRKTGRPKTLALVIFAVSFTLGLMLFSKTFKRSPVGVEWVRAG